MRTRHRPLALLLAALVALGAVACGDDDAEDLRSASEDEAETDDPEADTDGTDGTEPDMTEPDMTETDMTDVPVVASGDPAAPCTLLDAASFEAALGATIEEPEEVSDRFIVAGPEVESHACQWMATGTGGSGAVHVYSVELIVIPNGTDGEVYADLVRRARSYGDEVTGLELGDESVGVVDDGTPEVIVRSGDGVLVLRTASDDLGIGEFGLLAEAAVAAVEAN